MCISHPVPESYDQEILYRKIGNESLAVPETWEQYITDPWLDKEELVVHSRQDGIPRYTSQSPKPHHTRCGH